MEFCTKRTFYTGFLYISTAPVRGPGILLGGIGGVSPGALMPIPGLWPWVVGLWAKMGPEILR